jgi:hypothetical protein
MAHLTDAVPDFSKESAGRFTQVTLSRRANVDYEDYLINP